MECILDSVLSGFYVHICFCSADHQVLCPYLQVMLINCAEFSALSPMTSPAHDCFKVNFCMFMIRRFGDYEVREKRGNVTEAEAHWA